MKTKTAFEEMREMNLTYSLKEISEKHDWFIGEISRISRLVPNNATSYQEQGAVLREYYKSLKIIWCYVHEKFGEQESLKLTIKQSEMENNLLN